MHDISVVSPVGARPYEGVAIRNALDPKGVTSRIELENLIDEVEHRSSIGCGLLALLHFADDNLAEGLRGEQGGDERDLHPGGETIFRHL